MKELFQKYVREYTLPEIFCPGCGYGMFLNTFIRALDEMQVKKGDLGIISGGGCGAWMGMNLDYDVFKCIHGRSIAFAEGLKVARPDKMVVAFTGDGENVGIGGNHMIHAARRNMDITCIQLPVHNIKSWKLSYKLYFKLSFDVFIKNEVICSVWTKYWSHR